MNQLNLFKHFFVLLFIITTVASCVKWDLDFVDFITFNEQYDGEPGYNFKNDIIQLTDNSYLTVGTNADDSLLVSIVSEDGILTSYQSSIRRGVGHCIIKNEFVDNRFFIVGSSELNSFLLTINSEGILQDSVSYFDIINQEIGLLKQITLLDMVFEKEDNTILITGFLQQELGEKRSVLLKTDLNGDLIWMRSFSNNTISNCIRKFKTGYALSGFKDDNSWVSYINNEGALIWEQQIVNSKFTLKNEIEIFNDSLIFLANTKNNSPNEDFINVIGLKFNGNIILNKTYSDAGSNGYAIAIDRNNNLLVGGTNQNGTNDQFILLNITITGDVNWTKSFNCENNFIPSKIFQTNDFGFLSFGSSGNDDESQYKFIKTDEEGEIR